MNKESKTLLILGIITLFIFVGGIFFFTKEDQSQPENSTPVDSSVLYKSHNKQTSNQEKPIQIIEFGDFQCPACAGINPTLKKVISDREQDINFIFRHFPLPQHKNAMISSLAVEAAGEQGKYWEMYNKIFENQDNWSESDNAKEIFINYAKELTLDDAKFTQDLDKEELKARINTDMKDAQALGINSTPTFFVNGIKLSRPPSYSTFIEIIDQELAQ